MRLLDLLILRDLLNIRGRIISLLLIIACGVGILFGIQTALNDLVSTQDAVMDRMNMADLEISLLPEDVNNLPHLTDVSGVSAVESRLVMPGVINRPYEAYLSALVLFQGKEGLDLNQLSVLEGRMFRVGAGETVIDRGLAVYHGYRVGDRIDVRVGSKTLSLKITGIVMSPEFLVTSSNPDYVIVQPGSLGVMWTDIGQVSDALGFRMVNSLLFKFQKGAAPESVTRNIVDALNGKSIEKVTPREQGYSYKHVRMEVTAFAVYSPAIIITLCLLSLAMGVITFRRFFIEQQKGFGTIAALGYRRNLIMRSLLKMGCAIGALGGLLGLLIGWGLGWAFSSVYAAAMSLPLVVHSFDWILALGGFLLGLSVGCVSIMVAARSVLWRSPKSLMLDMSEPSRNGTVDGRVFGGARFGVVVRHALRSMVRERWLTISSILAIAGAVAVAVSYGMAMTSTLATVEENFEQERWQYAVDFQYPIYPDEVEGVIGKGEEDVQSYFRTSADVLYGGKHSVGVLVGQDPDGVLHQGRPAWGRQARANDEVMISNDIARALGVTLGNSLEVRKGEVKRHLRVVGVTNDIFLRTVSTTLETVQALAQAEDKATGAYVSDMVGGEGGIDRIRRNTEMVARVTDKKDAVNHFRKQMHDKMGIVYITIVFSIGVAILFVTTIIYLGISERRGEYAILRSLGFSGGRLRRIIYVGVFVQIGIALVISVPLSVLLVQILNHRMGAAWFAVQMHAGIMDFVWPFLAATIVAPVVSYLGGRQVLALRISDYLRRHAA